MGRGSHLCPLPCLAPPERSTWQGCLRGAAQVEVGSSPWKGVLYSGWFRPGWATACSYCQQDRIPLARETFGLGYFFLFLGYPVQAKL